MIEIAYIIGVSMAVTNTFKAKLPSNLVPLISVAIAIVLNIFNAWIFGGSLPDAGKDALLASGALVGLFAASDLVVNRTTKTE